MAFNYTLKYRTFDQLMADVIVDFKKYQQQSLIDPQELIKLVKNINYDLGLRIHKIAEAILDVEKGKVRMPNDFYILEFALVVSSVQTKQYLPQGTHIEEKVIGSVAPEYVPTPPEVIDLCETPIIPIEPINPCDPSAQEPDCCEDTCMLSCNNDVIQLVQKLSYQTREYKSIQPLRITSNTEKLNDLCPNLYWDSPLTAVMRDDWLHTSFKTGKVYINYQGFLEDAEGNLLVPDHDGLNEYYEYALKRRILENLIMNDEEVNPNKIALIEQRYVAARRIAKSIVNTPNFQEIKELYQANRNAQYSKYYDMFASYPRFNIR